MPKLIQGGYKASESKIRAGIAKAQLAVGKAKTPVEKRMALTRLKGWMDMAKRQQREQSKRRGK